MKSGSHSSGRDCWQSAGVNPATLVYKGKTGSKLLDWRWWWVLRRCMTFADCKSNLKLALTLIRSLTLTYLGLGLGFGLGFSLFFKVTGFGLRSSVCGLQMSYTIILDHRVLQKNISQTTCMHMVFLGLGFLEMSRICAILCCNSI